MPATRGELGARRPVHVGTRLIENEGSKALAVFPVFKGEVIERVHIDFYSVTKDDSVNVDQPPVFSSIMIYTGIDLDTFAGTSAGWDGFIARAFAPSTGEYIGGEPNPGGNVTAGRARGGRSTTMFKREVIGDPMPVGKDSLNNTDARFYDKGRTVVKKPVSVGADGVVIYGIRMARMSAQTDFGVNEVESSITFHDLKRAYIDPYNPGLGAQSAKAAELLYGGDNYIEADSFKEEDRRCYVILRPTIRRSEEFARTSY